MTRPNGTLSLVVQRVVLCVLAAVLFLEVGCVSRRAYEKVQAETLEHTQALEAVREDLRELDREIAGLQASNRHEDADVSDLRAAIQREEDQLPIMRQRAEDTLASLKTQVATLMNQSWNLARKIVDIRQESTTLQTKVAQYKEEIEQAQLSMTMGSNETGTPIAQAAVIEPPPSTVPADQTEVAPQIAQADPTPLIPAAPVTPVPAPSVEADPPSTSDSWIGTITDWFVKIWNWLFG